MKIDLIQLRTFVAVAEEGHLTRAAERLCISQSTASIHIKSVEEMLKTQLFVRTNRQLELTNAGGLLLRKAKTLLNEAVRFSAFARALEGSTDGTLTVGANSETVHSRISDIIATLRSRHPLVNLNLRAGTSTSTLQGLKTGELDIGILLGTPYDPAFTCYELTNVCFRVAGPTAWRKQIESGDWAELASLPWMLPSDNELAYTSRITQLFADKGLELNTVIRFDNATLARAILPAGVGMLLLREEQALQGEREGHLVLSPIAQIELPLLIVHLTHRASDPLICAFIEATAEVWPSVASVPARPRARRDG